jgi:hypothetical protein
MLAVLTAKLPASPVSFCVEPLLEVFSAPLAFSKCHADSSKKFATAISITELMLVSGLVAGIAAKFTDR